MLKSLPSSLAYNLWMDLMKQYLERNNFHIHIFKHVYPPPGGY